jgi:hypothetical protein
VKVEIVDQNVFGAIKPSALLRYLLFNDWREARRIENEFIVFTKDHNYGKIRSVWSPLSEEFSDYEISVAKVVSTISEVEDKSQLEIIDDLQTIAIGDVIGLRSKDPYNTEDHTLPLSEGFGILYRSRLMATAAASSVVGPRAVHPRRPGHQVSQFVKNLRLGQTERGSYMFRLISPIREIFQEEVGILDGIPDKIPFERRAVIELVKGLAALKEAAEDNERYGRFIFNTFVEAIPQGVSANLCEAVVSLNFEDEKEITEKLLKPLEVRVTWSYAVKERVNIPTQSISFDENIYPFIRQAAKEFRARNPEIVTIQGWVRDLSKIPHSNPGVIRILAHIDGKPRPVRAQLEYEVYKKALEAHRNDEIVELTGTLIVENGYYRLENPTDFHVIKQLDWLDRNASNQ